ncbi:MAG: hypothetical protein JSS86_15325 [Cyanobacteria bacterium SZAS LIN-2]|nr:hypothetical protein [Cyanobacteria bacterium SZAS LIN-3]MBS1997692.1 hypothetical protein [Cyanobacteria bacterium SZAS LIN-2]
MISNNLRRALSFAAACAAIVGGAATNSAARAAESEKDKELAAARDFFEQYKKLDQACDPKLTDLYAEDATIESDVERKGAPVQKAKYDRSKFCAQISKTFADPAMAKISKSTEYDGVEVKRELLDKNAINVVFHAHQGDTGMKVHWVLHRSKANPDQWQIHKEHSVTYRKSHGLKATD